MVTSMEAIRSSELQTLGVPLDGIVLERMLDIQISDNVVENIIENADLGGTYWAIHALICNVSLRRIRLDRCRVDPPWYDPEFSLLEVPRRNAQREYTYSPPAPSHPFARKDVLNHRFGREGWLDPGDSIDGYILGVGSEPIPNHYQQYQRVDVQLAIFDGRGNIYPESARVMLGRSQPLKRQREVRERASAGNQPKRKPIFEEG